MKILRSKLAKRAIDIRSLDYKDPEVKLNEARQQITVKQGIEADVAKKL